MTQHRQSIRLREYDYRRAGAYFVTICTFARECLFGEVVEGVVELNHAGMVVAECWRAIPTHFPNAELDAFVIMPNHVHGIVILGDDGDGVGARHASPDCGSVGNQAGATHAPPLRVAGPQPKSIGAIMGSFKSAATRRLNPLRDNPGAPVWQRNYYERVIRDEREMTDIRQYIVDNPAKWEEDEDHPARQTNTHDLKL